MTGLVPSRLSSCITIGARHRKGDNGPTGISLACRPASLGKFGRGGEVMIPWIILAMLATAGVVLLGRLLWAAICQDMRPDFDWREQ